MQQNESVGSVLDYFQLESLEFFQQNRRQFGGLQAVTYKLGQNRAAAEYDSLLRAVGNSTRAFTTNRPHLTCTFYDSAGQPGNVTCRAGATDICARPGTVGCTLHFKDVKVAKRLPNGEGVQLAIVYRTDRWGSEVMTSL
jgi:hypothetical protein